MKKLFFSVAAFLPFLCVAQLNLSLNGGYTLPTGEHHAQYEDDLLTQTNYSNKKSFTYASSFKVAWLLNHINIGIGADYGNYQTKKETDVTSGISFLPSSSFVAATGRYLAPHVFVNFHTTIARKLTIQAGLMAGILYTGFEKDNGILVVETEAVFGVIPAQTLGVEAHTGKPGETVSSNLVGGGQLELGYNINRHLNLNAEMAVRHSSVNAYANILGAYDQPFTYKLWYFPARIGLRYTFNDWGKKKTAPPVTIEDAAEE